MTISASNFVVNLNRNFGDNDTECLRTVSSICLRYPSCTGGTDRDEVSFFVPYHGRSENVKTNVEGTQNTTVFITIVTLFTHRL